ncbi:MAG: energy-coupling factor transporter transmembrane component T [Nitrososphaerales archaeon]
MPFFEYVQGKSIIHKMDIRPKILWFICIIVLAIVFWDLIYLAAIFASVMILAYIVKIPLTKFLSLMKILLIPLIFIFSYQALFYQGKKILFYLIPRIDNFGPYMAITLEGIILGLTFLLRILIMVMASSLLTITTPINHFIAFLRKFRLPYQIAFVITTAIRFIPVLERDALATIDAQKARGAELEASKGFLQIIKTYVPIMIPMLIGAIRRSETLGMAMIARGFGATGKWTDFYEIKAKKSDYFFTFLFLAILAFGLYLRAMGYGVG